MKQYKDIILHGASLFRQLKAGHPNSPNSRRTAISTATAGSGARPALKQRAALGIDGGDEPAGDDFFSMLGWGDEYLEQCGIDVDDMMNKAIGLNLDDLDDLDMLLAFKDEDEEECTAEDIAKRVSASENYLQCSGVADGALDLGASSFGSGGACLLALNSLLSLGGDLPSDIFDEDSDLGKSAKLCLESALGDNLIGKRRTASVANADSADTVTSRLQIHVPETLFRPGGYDHRDALFGVPPYGSSIAQSVYYADSDLCDPTVDTRKGYPIRSKDSKGQMEPWPSPYILMVDRGGCSFVQKVRNAQRTGASAVVIADNTCLCSDVDCVSANGEDVCQPAEPIMADDGSGGDISIPSFLMLKVDADQLKAELRANHMVQVEMQWALPQLDDRVEYDLWTTPSDPLSKDFQKKFKPVAEALGDRAYFTPHMYIYDGIKSNCQGFDGENMCFNLCTNNGRYCATDPDNDLDHGISGADVVKESLRRICIWKQYGDSDGVGSGWWDYVAQFMERCDSPNYFANDDCVRDAYKHADIKEDIIERCIRDSGGLDKDQTNTFLELEMEAQGGVVLIPTLFVNTVALRGGLSVDTVFAAVCSGYLEGTEPKVCTECAGCSDFDQCIAKKKCKSKGGGVSTNVFMSSILFLIGNLVRHEYKNLDKVLGCYKSYSKELPRCVLSVPIEDGTNISVPMSLYKKLYCLVGATSDVAIEGVCTGLYEMLDEGLPQEGAATKEYVYYPDDSQFLGIDFSVITGDGIPAYCSKIYEDQGMDGVGLQSRFEYYNAHREHGWTIEPSSTSPQAKAEFAAVSMAASATTSWAAASLAASARNREDGETTPETPPTKTKTAYLIAGGVGLAVLVVAAAAFYLRPKKTGGPGYSFVSRAFGNTLV